MARRAPAPAPPPPPVYSSSGGSPIPILVAGLAAAAIAYGLYQVFKPKPVYASATGPDRSPLLVSPQSHAVIQDVSKAVAQAHDFKPFFKTTDSLQ